MSNEAARQATQEFVDAQMEISGVNKEFIEGLTASPLGQVIELAGKAVGAEAAAAKLSGVSDPLQLSLLTTRLENIAIDFIAGGVIENTANRLYRLFSEASNMSTHLFERGPRFFYDVISKHSKKMARAIGTAVANATDLGAAVVEYNAFHQTCDRSQLDGLDPVVAAQFRAAAVAALSEIETAIRKSNAEGTNALLPERVVSAQRRATTVPGNVLSVPGADFIADGVRAGDIVRFVIVADRLGDPTSNLGSAQVFGVTAVLSPTDLQLAQALPAQTDVEYKVDRAAGAEAAAAALEAICQFIQNPTASIAVCLQEHVLGKLDACDKSVNEVLQRKAEFEASINNTVNANFIQPMKRTFSTAAANLKTDVEKLTAILGKPQFDKFTALNIIVDLCCRASVITQAFLGNPEGVKNEVEAEINFGVFEPATIAMQGLGETPAKDYLDYSPKYRQTAQAILITDIRPQLNARTTEILTKLAVLQAWYASVGGILLALPVVANVFAQGALEFSSNTGLDRLDDFLKSMNLADFAQESAETATKAGNAAREIGACIEDLPISQADKATALTRVRDELLGFERTQILTAEAIINESPAAIAEVDGSAQQAQRIQEQVDTLLA